MRVGKVLNAALIGAGNRGEIYTDFMGNASDRFKVVVVVDPKESRRKNIMQKHGISKNMCFSHWDEFFAKGRISDFVIISTQDRLHFEPAMKAIALKYDVLPEKPVSPDIDECLKIACYAREMNVKVVVCHILRYTPVTPFLRSVCLLTIICWYLRQKNHGISKQ